VAPSGPPGLIPGMPFRPIRNNPRQANFYAAAVYGSIVSAGVVTALRQEHDSLEAITLTLVSTLVVLWLAHVWSVCVGEQLDPSVSLGRERVRLIARAEWPLVEAGLFPTIFLVLGWLGVLDASKALAIAIAACNLELFVWGFAAGRSAFERWWQALLSGLANGALGLLLVALELHFVH
jgi:hypothetical protein